MAKDIKVYTEGMEIPEGYKKEKCNLCGTEFIIPENETVPSTGFVCSECASKTTTVNDSASDEVKKALGN